MASTATGKPPAAETTDESTAGGTSSSSTTSDESASKNDDNDVKNIKKLFTETKVSGGKSAWATTMETLGMSDGKKKKGDILFDGFDEAMAKCREMVLEKNWEFATTPFEDFQATQDDLLKAFVHWSRKGDDDGERSYNVSKAFRRLEGYVDWMDKNCKGMNLKGSSMKEVADVWKMKVTHDKNNRLIWWIDMGGLDLQYIKEKLPHEDTLRYFVWLSHLVLFDSGSQTNGLVFIESLGHKGMMESMTAISMDVGTKLDRLTIGILPIKMEACYLYNNPTWMNVVMALMSPFMGKKMRKRIQTLTKKQDPQTFFEEALGGKDHIPTGVAQLEGTVEKDVVEETLARLS